jgi:hypothetical protein
MLGFLHGGLAPKPPCVAPSSSSIEGFRTAQAFFYLVWEGEAQVLRQGYADVGKSGWIIAPSTGGIAAAAIYSAWLSGPCPRPHDANTPAGSWLLTARVFAHPSSSRAVSVHRRWGFGMIPTRAKSKRSASQQACSVWSPSVRPSVCRRHAWNSRSVARAMFFAGHPCRRGV